MTPNLSSRFSDSTIASASSSFSKLSSASSAPSVEDLLLPAFDAIPKPPPRTSSITLDSTKTYTERRERKKPAPLQLVSSTRSARAVERASSSSSDGEEHYFSCGENQRGSRLYQQPRCFCGSAVRASTSASTSCSTEIYCSRECARQDALYALEGRSPTSSPSSSPYSENEEEDEDFPVTPTNAFVPSPPMTPAAKGRALVERRRNPSLTRKLTGLGASHYRRMEALGLYDTEHTPTRPSNSSPLLDPIDLMVAHSPSSKSARLHASVDDEDELDFNPRKTLFFPVPIYMGSPLHA